MINRRSFLNAMAYVPGLAFLNQIPEPKTEPELLVLDNSPYSAPAITLGYWIDKRIKTPNGFIGTAFLYKEWVGLTSVSASRADLKREAYGEVVIAEWNEPCNRRCQESCDDAH